MAERCLLHINKLEAFKEWLTVKGYTILPVKGLYEVLRCKKDKNTIIIFKKSNATEHLSVQDKDYYVIKQFIRESKERGEKNETGIVT